MTNAAKEWIEVGNFDSVTAASRRICEIEGGDGDAHGLLLEFYVQTGEWGTDEEAFRVFHYTSIRARYGIKRTRPNSCRIPAPRFFPTVTFGEKGQ
jgi:hypothetical protein